VLELEEARVTADVLAAAQSPDTWEAAAAEPGTDRRHMPAEVRPSR